MLELHDLLTKAEPAGRTRGQINLANRYLRRQTKMIGRRRAAGNNGFAAANLGFLDDFLD
ncbi:hypothetical protein XH94_30480 [Bradyrhizobium zhanjiangense]|uniref:Uncharacterized protein n=1 Tax=Bradyrhizobium zhanjiangense TaxID=1325107 RepID=A0A4Q0SBJ1_9BRAD|nr:hypothetical protein XH94_30480 [Bradyrhizobium zhanjiangense]